MRAVDTNVLIRLVVRDDLEQVRAAEEFTSKGAWASHLVLAETVQVLEAVYDRTAEQITGAIDMLLNHQDLTVQDSQVVSAALEDYRKRPSISFSDCATLEIARKAGRHLPLAMFDRNLAKLEGTQRL